MNIIERSVRVALVTRVTSLPDQIFFQLLVGQRLIVGEQIFAQIGDNALADALQNDGLEIGKPSHRKHQHARIDGHARKEARGSANSPATSSSSSAIDDEGR